MSWLLEEAWGEKVAVVIVVVSHIQRVGCYPKNTTLNGGQSRSCLLNREKKISKKKSGSAPPPPPAPPPPLRCSFGENKIK